MSPQIGKLYKRYNVYNLDSKKINYERDNIIIVVGIKDLIGESIVLFHYLDDPEEMCEWNLAAFIDGMVEL